jgi:hypothetical protein
VKEIGLRESREEFHEQHVAVIRTFHFPFCLPFPEPARPVIFL